MMGQPAATGQKRACAFPPFNVYDLKVHGRLTEAVKAVVCAQGEPDITVDDRLAARDFDCHSSRVGSSLKGVGKSEFGAG